MRHCPTKYTGPLGVHVDEHRHEVVLTTSTHRHRFSADQTALLRDALSEAISILTAEEVSQ